MRIVFYASNGFGLGHLMRTLAVARQVRKRAADAEIVFMTNSEASHLAWDEGFATIKLMSRFVPARGRPEHERMREVNRAIVAATLRSFDPDVIVVDSYPRGAMRELTPMLRREKCRRVFIYREKNQEVRHNETLITVLDKYYDLMLVPHRQNEFSMPIPARLPVVFTDAIMIRGRGEAMDRQQARARLGLPDDAFIVYVGFGGGGDKQYRELRDWVLAETARHPDWLFAVARPPLFKGPAPEGGSNLVEFAYFPLAECWPAFDAAISALGFNTTSELLHQGVPSLFIELAMPDDDQGGRAARIVAAGAGFAMRPHETAKLVSGLDALADPARRAAMSAAARKLVPVNGAAIAAEAIVALAAAPMPQRPVSTG
jgi:UDP-N-acetylglucosamine--N-acetylmuramyl-(pentapeptide) pyrophosphoryl-undecaprenol N-acetylglucosamine transferase